MSAMSDYLENKLVDFLLRAGTFTKPTVIAVALYTVAPTDGTAGTEVTGGNYSRVTVGPSDTAWNATQGGTSGNSSGTGGLSDNAADVVFPTPNANWGTIVGFGLIDAATSGNLLIYSTLSQSKTVNNGDAAPKFLAGALDIVFG